MKTSDLTGSLLDQWVARALGLDTLPLEPGNWCWVYVKNGTAKEAFRPSQDWAHGGPIIEERKIDIAWLGGRYQCWKAYWHDPTLPEAFDKSPLVAACRILVAAKFGDTLPVAE